MASVNKAILIGNLGADPETRSLPSGDTIANLRIATTDRYRDKQSGEMKESTEWHRVSFFGRLAEISSQYLRKGSLIYIEGRIRTRKWQDQSGLDRYSTEIIGEQMQMLGGRNPNSSGNEIDSNRPNQSSNSMEIIGNNRIFTEPSRDNAVSSTKRPFQNSGSLDEIEDDIPF